LQNFNQKLVNTPNKTNRPKILNIHDIRFLRDEGDKGCIKRFFKLPLLKNFLKKTHNIILKNLPTMLEKGHSKTIRARSFISLQIL
jgi:hypothetical protein